MSKIQSWEVSDAFWERVKPLIPAKERSEDRTYHLKPGAERKPIEPRRSSKASCTC